MRESVHLGATVIGSRGVICVCAVGVALLTRPEDGEWGYAWPNICNPVAHRIGATARAAEGVQNLRSGKLPRYAC